MKELNRNELMSMEGGVFGPVAAWIALMYAGTCIGYGMAREWSGQSDSKMEQICN
jgi:lactobin A/cerein 7B family class IIb bacteriocin